MRLTPVSQHLLVFISVLSLTRAQNASTTTLAATQTTPAPTTPAPSTVSATPTTTAWPAPAIFYPFGSAAGDTETFETGGETYQYVSFSTPFTFFGHTYNSIYVNNNGLLSFNQPIPEAHPYVIPTHGADDFIAVLWTELDDIGFGKYWYQEYTSGSVLTRATQDINQYFPQMNFSASWVFVVTWDYVQTSDMNVFNLRSAPTITFQTVLISGGGLSFILMNYGDCADVVPYPVEAGYDTVGSTDYYVIHYANDGYSISNLKNTSNVDVLGRWAFDVNNRTGTTVEPTTTPLTTTTTTTTTTTKTTTAWTAPAIFYPFGSAAGDTEIYEYGGESYYPVGLSTPFTFFGHTYNNIYVNYNGLLSFNMRSISGPYYIPTRGAEDYIAALWNDFDDYYSGVYSFQQYTSGSVLTRATQDINQYFPQMSFTASWVFVVTWKYNLQPNPAILFQVVLISGGGQSFFLMNYGDCAVLYGQVEAGYDTINSISHFVIPDSTNGNYQNLKNTSNVNVPGRWAFISTSESLIGVQMALTSYLDLTQSREIEVVLQQIKQELVSRGLSSNIEMKIRNVKKTKP